MVRAKFRVNEILHQVCNTGAKLLRFTAVCADELPENQRYHKYTPNGSLEMYVNNPAATDQFELGKCYYLDFTPAEG